MALPDESSPVLISCPDDITVATSDGNTAVPASWLVPQAVDDSGVVNVDNNNGPGDLFNLGTNTVTYTFTDNAGNFVVCSFDVNVIRKHCPSAMIVNALLKKKKSDRLISL